MMTDMKQFDIALFHRDQRRIIGRCEDGRNLEISTAKLKLQLRFLPETGKPLQATKNATALARKKHTKLVFYSLSPDCLKAVVKNCQQRIKSYQIEGKS